MSFRVDYWKLNAVKARDTYPLPRMDECIGTLGETTVFSSLDANWGYWKIPIDEADKDKTTFSSHTGTCWFERMPFGPMNAPATFQRTLDVIVKPF